MIYSLTKTLHTLVQKAILNQSVQRHYESIHALEQKENQRQPLNAAIFL